MQPLHEGKWQTPLTESLCEQGGGTEIALLASAIYDRFDLVLTGVGRKRQAHRAQAQILLKVLLKAG